MPDALEKIRLDLGQDAVILNTKPVRTGGFLGMFRKQQIEVIAAVDTSVDASLKEKREQVPSDRSPARVNAVAARQAYRRAEPRHADSDAQLSPAPPAAPVERGPEGMSATADRQTARPAEQGRIPPSGGAARHERLRELTGSENRQPGQPVSGISSAEGQLVGELRDIREMFNKLLLKEDGVQTLPAPFVAIRDRLLSQEVEPQIVSSLLRKLLQRWEHPETAAVQDVRLAARQLLVELIRDKAPLTPTLPRSVRHAYFFGPTGVGKTTTIAKLAAECILKEKRKVGFITSDTYRIAAVEQLKTYANILNAPLEVVFSAHEIKQAMERLSDCELILIDTAGRNYRNDEYVQAMKELLQVGEACEHYLVLSLTSRYADMQAIVDRFHDIPYTKVIFTKSDETESYGTIVNVVHNYDLSLSFLTTGQNVPDDYTLATPERIADLILGEVQHA